MENKPSLCYLHLNTFTETRAVLEGGSYVTMTQVYTRIKLGIRTQSPRQADLMRDSSLYAMNLFYCHRLIKKLVSSNGLKEYNRLEKIYIYIV